MSPALLATATILSEASSLLVSRVTPLQLMRTSERTFHVITSVVEVYKQVIDLHLLGLRQNIREIGKGEYNPPVISPQALS